MMAYGIMKLYLFGYTCLAMDVRDSCTLDGQRVGLRSREIDKFWKRCAAGCGSFLYGMNGMEALPAPSVVS